MGAFDEHRPPTGSRGNTLKRWLSRSADSLDEEMTLAKPVVNKQVETRRSKRFKISGQRQHYLMQADGSKTKPFTIASTNIYDPLADKEDDIRINKDPSQTVKKKLKIPPITATTQNKKLIIDTINSFKITNYRLRFTSMGINIFFDEVADFKTVRDGFKNSNINFFTHELPEEKAVKVVLRGLDLMDTKDLAQLLGEKGVTPTEIRTITPRQSRYTNHANYVLSFVKDKFNMGDLHKIKALNHVIIHWEYYRKNANGPTQCRKCLRPGHGTRNCNLAPRCKYCAENHISDECEEMKKALSEAAKVEKAMQIDGNSTNEASEVLQVQFTPKCCNCGEKHVATASNCKARIEFINLQRQLATRNRNRQTRKTFAVQQYDFPDLPGTQQQRNHQGQDRTINHPHGISYSQAARLPGTSTSQAIGGSSNPLPSSLHNPSNHPQSNLFSYEEITALLQDVLRGLRTCRDKFDQLQVITDVAIKYLYGGSN